ncbi:MAG: ThiF family adenylyltransferase [Candidatus Krumholzibacteriia bacterium]
MDGIESDVLRLEDVEVTLVGAGRAGSQIALVLAQLGVRQRIYDGDRLGPENQGLQLYRKEDVTAGKQKVEALREHIGSIVPESCIEVHAEAFEAREDQRRSPVVVIAVDTMETRRRLWERLKNAKGILRLLDVRLGRALVRLHEVRPSHPQDVADYEASLHDDAVAAAADCADEATTHAAAAAAALVGGALRGLVDDLPRPRWIALDLDRAIWASGKTT